MRRRLILTLLLAAPLVAACGGSNSNETAAPATATATVTETPTPAPAATGKPTVKAPTGKAPTKLVIKDLKRGTGATAKEGRVVTVQYVGVLYKDGKQFDASWDRGQPFQFQLGAGMVIPGWDQGVKGMKVGGRRELIIPPDLAYGPSGNGPIGPNETLIFVIDLEDVGSA